VASRRRRASGPRHRLPPAVAGSRPRKASGQLHPALRPLAVGKCRRKASGQPQGLPRALAAGKCRRRADRLRKAARPSGSPPRRRARHNGPALRPPALREAGPAEPPATRAAVPQRPKVQGEAPAAPAAGVEAAAAGGRSRVTVLGKKVIVQTGWESSYETS
jgi:hypothetical protein